MFASVDGVPISPTLPGLLLKPLPPAPGNPLPPPLPPPPIFPTAVATVLASDATELARAVVVPVVPEVPADEDAAAWPSMYFQTSRTPIMMTAVFIPLLS